MPFDLPPKFHIVAISWVEGRNLTRNGGILQGQVKGRRRIVRRQIMPK
jgi:hypothetical protein